MSSYQVFPILLASFWRDFKPISVTFEISSLSLIFSLQSRHLFLVSAPGLKKGVVSIEILDLLVKGTKNFLYCGCNV